MGPSAILLGPGSMKLLVAVLLLACTGGSVANAQKSWKPVGSPVSPTYARPRYAVYVSLDLDKKDNYKPYVAWVSDNYAYAAFRNGGKWSSLGKVSPYEAEWTDLALNPTTKAAPWVAFKDTYHNNELSVRAQKVPSLWKDIGKPGFSDGDYVSNVNLAFSPSGIPLAAYQDSKDGYAYVRRWDGTKWALAGGTPVSSYAADFISLATSPKNEFYVAYQDFNPAYYNYGRLRKFRPGTPKVPPAWVDVGSYFSEGTASCIALTVSPKNYQPYIVFRDGANSNKLTVVTYSQASGWKQVGPSFGDATYGSIFNAIAFDSNGRLHVAGQCKGYLKDSAACVWYYANGKWSRLGAKAFSKGNASFINLKFAGLVPYVAFSDTGTSTPGQAVVYKYA